MSIKEVILDFLHKQYLKDRKRYVSGKTIEDNSIFNNWKKSNVSRRCRELAEDFLIDRFLEKRKGRNFVMYRFKKQKDRIVWKKGKLT